MAKTHPHIDSPTPAQLAELVKESPEPLQQVYLALHEIVLAAVPEVEYSVDTVDKSIGYGARQFGYNGWGMAALTPYKKWVSLTLMQGSQLSDPQGLFTGTAVMRHVKLSTLQDVEERREGILALVKAATEL